MAVESIAVPKGYRAVGVPIDGHGIIPAALEKVGSRARQCSAGQCRTLAGFPPGLHRCSSPSCAAAGANAAAANSSMWSSTCLVPDGIHTLLACLPPAACLCTGAGRPAGPGSAARRPALPPPPLHHSPRPEPHRLHHPAAPQEGGGWFFLSVLIGPPSWSLHTQDATCPVALLDTRCMPSAGSSATPRFFLDWPPNVVLAHTGWYLPCHPAPHRCMPSAGGTALRFWRTTPMPTSSSGSPPPATQSAEVRSKGLGPTALLRDHCSCGVLLDLYARQVQAMFAAWVSQPLVLMPRFAGLRWAQFPPLPACASSTRSPPHRRVPCWPPQRACLGCAAWGQAAAT